MIEFHAAEVVAPTADGDVTILHPLTLSLTERKISIIGGNGSGKSTLARLINGLVVPTAGAVRVTATADAPPLDTRSHGAAVRKRVGFVFTDPAAQTIMPTVIEDVELSLRKSHRDKAERRAAAREALARFGLEGLHDRSVHTLSGGQRQLLALASVLATSPAIVVADEPTTLLDLHNARRIGDLLMGLPEQTIVATHDLELAARADRTLVISGGRVVFDDAPQAAIAWYRTHA